MRHPDPPTADVPGYLPLRMAAEWAGAVRDRTLSFRYDPDAGCMTLADPAVGGGIPARTDAFATRPRVTAVELTVTDADGRDVTRAWSADGISALLWSESAVEKFLLPYLASVTAHEAARFLGRVSRAWYGYPGTRVQVVAIARLLGPTPPPDGTPLTPERALGLVCLTEEDGTLELWTLDEFEARYGTGGPGTVQRGAPAPPERCRGWEIGAALDSVVARDVAEFVSGLRGNYVAFRHEGDSLVPELFPDGPPDTGADALFSAEARRVRPDRPAPSRVVLWVEAAPEAGATPFTLVPVLDDTERDRIPDSAFWTDGAVEALLLPYYASVKGGGSWLFLLSLMAKWDGVVPPDAYGLAELIDAAAGVAAAEREGGEVSSVFATLHLPRSEYAEDADPAALVLALRPDGTAAASAVWRGQSGADAGPAAKRSRKTASRAR